MSNTAKNKKVLVTGASGYIAMHVIDHLVKSGFQVRGTVRSLANKSKVQPVRNLFPGIELVEADLCEDGPWGEAVRGCRDVVHVASPFPPGPTDRNKLRQPAVMGTLRVLNACLEAQVRRVVLTSSIYAIHGEPEGEENRVYTEEDWTNLESPNLDGYTWSKTVSERLAWDFVKEKDKCFELAVINPALVLGPILSPAAVSTSVSLVKRMMDGAMPFVPHLNYTLCDVRDVAAAHVQALLGNEAVGHRHIISSDRLWLKEMAKILADEFKPLGYGISCHSAPNVGVKLMSFFDAGTRILVPHLDRVERFSNARMMQALFLTPRDAKQTLLDTAYSLIRHEVVKETKGYKAKLNPAEILSL